MEFFAHSRNENGQWHYLKDHLNEVGDQTQIYAKSFYKGQFTQVAEFIGLYHDLGKVHPEFQEYLLAVDAGYEHRKVPHSPWGALFIYLMLQNSTLDHVLGMPVAGHHSGLDEVGNLTVKLKSYESNHDILNLMLNVAREITEQRHVQSVKMPSLESIQIEFLIRMLFSALIDADRLNTESHFSPQKVKLRENHASLEKLAGIFYDNQNLLIEQTAKSKPTVVNQVRTKIYQICLAQGVSKPGLFRLTVPTGGGKTRSALAFALSHAVINEQKRIVFALPYTSIIDQTAQVYKEIFGDYAILEHHSQFDFDDDEEQNDECLRLRLAEENWDVPIIVTTTVQLLESLFSNRPAQCRKVHNLTQSVIIFDEAQALPLELIKPTFQVLRDMIENYGTTVVLSTATQPSLKGSYLQEFSGMEIQEIVSDFDQDFADLTRVKYRRINKPLSMEELAQEISKFSQVLVIMNTRKQALNLVKELKGDGCIHLSTLLCGKHRKKVLSDVRDKLKKKLPIRLISTQVVEAGVDLDFPIVYRILGPLDRIVQAAGRCNREGIMDELGTVTIFELISEQSPRGSYKAGLEMTKLILAESDSTEALNSPKIFEDYFSGLYNTMGNDLDKYGVQKLRKLLDYPKTADVYRLINDDTVSVVVRYGDYEYWLNQWLRYPGRDTWRKLQPFIVNIYKWEVRAVLSDGMLSEMTKGLYLWEGVYDELIGISIENDPADYVV